MKIAFLTNLLHTEDQHMNIGDVFIGMGLKHLLKEALEPEHDVEFIMLSRFTKLSKENLDKMKECDFIVYGGMPQYNNLDDWKFYYDDEIWDDINSTGVPVLRLAGGGGFGSETMNPTQFAKHLNGSDFTKQVLKRALTNTKLVTTRDKMAQSFLQSNNVESTLLPCSGTFAAYLDGQPQRKPEKYNVICLTASYLENREDKDDLVKEFIKTKEYLEKETGNKCYMLGQVHKNDFPFLNEHFKDVITFKKPMEVLDFYKGAEYCVTSRLHCGLPVFGLGGKVFGIRVDTRGIAFEELNIPVVKLSDYKHADFAHCFVENEFSKLSPERVRQQCLDFYREKLKEIIKNL